MSEQQRHGPRRSKILVRGASRQELDAALASEVC